MSFIKLLLSCVCFLFSIYITVFFQKSHKKSHFFSKKSKKNKLVLCFISVNQRFKKINQRNNFFYLNLMALMPLMALYHLCFNHSNTP
jgi:hypothetical protein